MISIFLAVIHKYIILTERATSTVLVSPDFQSFVSWLKQFSSYYQTPLVVISCISFTNVVICLFCYSGKH